MTDDPQQTPERSGAMACSAVCCPNCLEMVDGLYCGDHGVTHCGCYHEGGGIVSAETDEFWAVWEYDADGYLVLKQNSVEHPPEG